MDIRKRYGDGGSTLYHKIHVATVGCRNDMGFTVDLLFKPTSDVVRCVLAGQLKIHVRHRAQVFKICRAQALKLCRILRFSLGCRYSFRLGCGLGLGVSYGLRLSSCVGRLINRLRIRNGSGGVGGSGFSGSVVTVASRQAYYGEHKHQRYKQINGLLHDFLPFSFVCLHNRGTILTRRLIFALRQRNPRRRYQGWPRTGTRRSS